MLLLTIFLRHDQSQTLEQIQAHLRVQDDAINALLDKVEKLETSIARS